MVNHYLYIREDGTWNWSDGVFSGIATLRSDKVSEYCLEQAEKMRYSEYGNYDYLSKDQREEWNDRTFKKYIIIRKDNEISVNLTHVYDFLAFHTAEQRDLFLEENEDLVKDYLMLD